MRGLKLASVMVKQEIDDEDVDFGMASNIIIEVVEPVANSSDLLTKEVSHASTLDPPWTTFFISKFDNYNGIVESLRDIQEVVNCLEESTRTRFSVIKTRRKSFGCTEFNPDGIKVYWGEDGVPYTILNKKLLDCQHGRYRRPLPKGEKKVGKAMITPDGVLRYKGTKKLGCPAQIRLREILRFPDFKVLETTAWRQKVQSKVLKKAFQSADVLTSHRCFVVSLPKIEQHENHFIEPPDVKPIVPRTKKKRTVKAHEPVHPKIIQKIRELSYEGISGTKNVREGINEFITEELSQEEEILLDCRRFNPRDQDIRNVVKKVQTDLRKNGTSLAEVQCDSIIKDLQNVVASTNDEKYLEQLKQHLDYLRTTVKLKAPLEPLSAGFVKSDSPAAKKLKNSEEEEVMNYSTFAIANDNQMLYEDEFAVKGDQTHTVYYYE